MDNPTVQKIALDAAIAAPALTFPAWWPWLSLGWQVLLGLAGAYLVYLRIKIARRELRERESQPRNRRASDRRRDVRDAV